MTSKTDYSFRESTLNNNNQAAPPTSPKSSRKILTPSKSATLTRSQTHDCETLDITHTTNKVATRLMHSLFRFSLAHVYQCTTWRGTTHLNGAKSTCGSCEAAHAALSPTLYDDILQNIHDQLKSKNFNELNSALQSYLESRFDLSEDDKNKLACVKKEDREKHLSELMSRLTLQERKGSFVNTPTEHQRNATFENHRSSNKVDCYLEHHLRPLEDKLANECKTEEKTPIQALEELQKVHRELLEIALKNIKDEQLLLDDFHANFSQLITAEIVLDAKSDDKTFLAFKGHIEKYQKSYEAFFTKRKGAPRFKSFNKLIDSEQSPYALQAIHTTNNLRSSRNRYEIYKRFLKNTSCIDDHFEAAQKELDRRAVEAENQLKILCQNTDDIKAMLKYQFGTKDDHGILRTPTKADIANALNPLLTRG